MQSEDEVVETSDLEELAELEASKISKSTGSAQDHESNVEFLPRSPPSKRIKLQHEFQSDGSSVSPARSLTVHFSTPDKLQYSSTTLGSSPPSRLSISQSFTQTPGSALVPSFARAKTDPLIPVRSSPIPLEPLSQGRLISESPIRSAFYLFQDASEVDKLNPLKECIRNNRTTTPVDSPPGPRLHLPSIESPHLFGSPPPQPLFLKSPLNVIEKLSDDDSIDDNLNGFSTFTSTRPPLEHTLSPALTPVSHSSRSQTSEPSIVPDVHQNTIYQDSVGKLSPESQRSQSPSPVNNAIDQEGADSRLAQGQDHEGRYPKRPRNAAQLRPYTVDNLMYRMNLKHNPEAIINNKSLDRRRHSRQDDHYEEEEGTQQDGYVYDGDDDNEEERKWEERQDKRTRREERRRRIAGLRLTSSGQGQESAQYPAILQEDLSTTDEEVEKEMKLLSKEGRKLLKQQQRKRKAQQMEDRLREQKLYHAQRFPNPVPASPPRKSSGSVRPSRQLFDLNDKRDNEVPTVRIQRERLSFDMEDLLIDSPVDNDGLETYGNDTFHAVKENAHPRSPDGAKDSSGRTLHFHTEEDGDEVGFKTTSQGRDTPNSSSESDIMRGLPSKHARALRKMLPMVMIQRMYGGSVNTSSAKKKRHRAPEDTVEDDVGGTPLLPGRTRVRHTGNLQSNKELKGDSESEIDVVSHPDISGSDEHAFHDFADRTPSQANESDADDILTAYGHHSKNGTVQPQVVDVDDQDNDHTEDEAGIQFVSYHKAKTKGATSRRRDPSMIDYMLARPSAFDESSRRKGFKKYELDVTTGGARRFGRERQTLLSFEKHSKNKKAGTSVRPHSELKAIKSKKFASEVDGIYSLDDSASEDSIRASKRTPRHSTSGRRLARGLSPTREVQRKKNKEEKKGRRRMNKKAGLYIRNHENRRIESGKVNKTAYVSIVQTEHFHRALAPRSPAFTRKSDQSQRLFVLPEHSCKSQESDSSSFPTVKDAGQGNLVEIPTDFRIDPLLSGTSFAISTYIRKGWLYELINVSFSDKEPGQPSSATLLGFRLEPTMSIQTLSSLVPRICGSFYDFATSLPDPDDEVSNVQWMTMTHLLSQFISWSLANGAEQEVHPLREVVKHEVTRFVQYIEKLSLVSVQKPLLTFCWFAVELSVRVGPRSVPLSDEGCPEGLIKDTTTLLMRLLIRYDLHRAVRVFATAHDTPVTESSPAYVAELLVRLIHLLGHCSPLEKTSTQRNHPFWVILMNAIDLHIQTIDAATSSFETSEIIWRSIYSICALSHFSVHGMTVGQTHLPACWDVVAYGLRSIRLTQMPLENYQTTKGAPLGREIDRYVALVVNRCFLLRERWRWKLSEAAPMFYQLCEIFRSRKFANLWHEKCDYPRFLKEGNWALLEAYDHRDTAYTIFLKLVYQAVREDKLYAEGKPSPKVRKLLSMATSMSALPFSKTNPPREEDLPMFYNRISALAIVGDTENGDCKDKVEIARRYISFSDADAKSRVAIFNGMASWAKLMVSRGRPLDAFGEWIRDMANTIKAEFGAASQKNGGSPTDLRFAKFCVDALFCRVRHIIRAHTQESRYPDPVLFSSLEPILRSREIVCGDLQEFGYFASALFDARAKALPPPPRPFPASLPPTVDEDSQDYGNMDLDLDNLDWSATDVPEALVSADIKERGESENNEAKESKLRSSFVAFGFKWLVYHFVKKYIRPPRPGVNLVRYTSECDFWIRLWLCCACVDSPSDDWSRYFNLLETLLNPEETRQQADTEKDERWLGRVRLSIMFQALKLKPMLYLTKMDQAFEVFLHALASDNNTNTEGKPRKSIERVYVAYLLSIDRFQHPLLSDVERLLPARDEGDYEISPEEFLALRVPLLDAIFKNLNNLLCKNLEANLEVPPEVKKYIEFCRSMFSTMRYSLLKRDKTSAKYLADNDFCHQVVHALRKNAELCAQQVLRFWADDWPNNLIPARAPVPSVL